MCYKSRLFVSFVCLLFLPVTAQSAYVWQFTNSGLSYGPADTIYLEAQVTNTGAESIVIDVNIAPFGQGIGYGSFPTAPYPGPEDYEFSFTAHQELIDQTLLPGESRAFRFGMFTPVSTVAAGFYETYWADLTTNGESMVEANGGRFAATVVPVPAALWLFASGIGLIALRRNGWRPQART